MTTGTLVRVDQIEAIRNLFPVQDVEGGRAERRVSALLLGLQGAHLRKESAMRAERERIAAKNAAAKAAETERIARIAANTAAAARAHLTTVQKQEAVGMLLERATPGTSDRAIARALGVSPTMVGKVRATTKVRRSTPEELEAYKIAILAIYVEGRASFTHRAAVVAGLASDDPKGYSRVGHALGLLRAEGRLPGQEAPAVKGDAVVKEPPVGPATRVDVEQAIVMLGVAVRERGVTTGQADRIMSVAIRAIKAAARMEPAAS